MIVLKYFTPHGEDFTYTIAEKSSHLMSSSGLVVHETNRYSIPIVASSLEDLKKKLRIMLETCEKGEVYFLRPARLEKIDSDPK